MFLLSNGTLVKNIYYFQLMNELSFYKEHVKIIRSRLLLAITVGTESGDYRQSLTTPGCDTEANLLRSTFLLFGFGYAFATALLSFLILLFFFVLGVGFSALCLTLATSIVSDTRLLGKLGREILLEPLLALLVVGIVFTVLTKEFVSAAQNLINSYKKKVMY